MTGHTTPSRLVLAIVAFALTAVAPAFAQKAEKAEGAQAEGTVQPETASLNREQAERAEQENRANAANAANYTAAAADYQVARDAAAAARRNYEADMEAYRQAQAAYQAALADVAACNAGQRERCPVTPAATTAAAGPK